MEPFIGEIIIVGFDFAPSGYALCQGQLVSVAQNSALYALIGNRYGGNGTTTFALPDLRGRVPINAGGGAGVTSKNIGERGGTEAFTLQSDQLPAHTHTLSAFNGAGNSRNPGGNALAIEAAGQTTLYSSDAPNVAMNAASIGPSNGGNGGQPVNNVPPFLVLNFAIALTGEFPRRD